MGAVFAFLFVAIPTIQAAEAYQAAVSTAQTTIAAGQSKQITLKFTNIGTATWVGSQSKTAVYLYGSSSIFGHPSWLMDDLPAVIAQSSVKPGQVASATFWVKAPTAPGTYTERFLLSYGSNAWIKGSVVTVTFTVTGSATPASPPSVPASTVSTPAPSATAYSLPPTASSLNPLEWKAELASMGGIEWQLDPGKTATITLAFKNAGSRSWKNSGDEAVTVVAGGGQAGAFKDTSWKTATTVVGLQESLVKPGQTGHVTFVVRAAEVPGMYRSSFSLTVGDKVMPGGTATLPIRVTAPFDYIAKGILNGVEMTDEAPAPTINGLYQATLLLSSAKSATLLGNARLSLTYGFKNSGTIGWNTLSFRLVSLSPNTSGAYRMSIRDDSWYAVGEPVHTEKVTKVGEIGFLGFTIKAPAKKGSYTASFQLYADGQAVQGGTLDLPITVTDDGYLDPAFLIVPTSPVVPSYSTPSSAPAQVLVSGDPSALPDQPIIRVGLFATTDDRMMVRGVNGGYTLQQNGAIICRFQTSDVVTVSYDRAAKVYKASGPGCATQSSTYYVAVANDNISPLEMTDFYRPVSWLPGANDNTFRAKLELRYTPATDLVWVINELPIEPYLKGMAETSDVSPLEYQKALMTAARTYAMYHVNRGTKHADEFYTVDAKYDQVYRGYGAEARGLNIGAGIDATRGQIVTYNGSLAITPYYSRSDGRTRDWKEVWGGKGYAWLVSVPVPEDVGRTLWGHGVGMSATGALDMANKGQTYDQILKHFYQGTALTQIYK